MSPTVNRTGADVLFRQGYYGDELLENESLNPLFSTRNFDHLPLKFPTLYSLYMLLGQGYVPMWRKDSQFNIASYVKLI